MIDVSFFVPTLNRNPVVLRAVQTCLAAIEQTGVTGEVIVLDSQSDDGSWEALQEAFGSDPRVILRQNQRGLGPVKSWCDNVEGFRGRYATFVWSDDYIAPHFLDVLLPPLEAGASVAIGEGPIRTIDCTDPLASVGAVRTAPSREVMAAYLKKTRCRGFPLPFSPAAALLPADTFRTWLAEVEDLSTSSELRRHFMWRSAIGPDLLLFLIALAQGEGQVGSLHDAEVANFSAHEGSITVSSTTWRLTMGYWLARCAFVRSSRWGARIGHRADELGELILQARVLKLRAPSHLPGFDGRAAIRRAIQEELDALLSLAHGIGVSDRFGLRLIPSQVGGFGRRVYNKLIQREQAVR